MKHQLTENEPDRKVVDESEIDAVPQKRLSKGYWASTVEHADLLSPHKVLRLLFHTGRVPRGVEASIHTAAAKPAFRSEFTCAERLSIFANSASAPSEVNQSLQKNLIQKNHARYARKRLCVSRAYTSSSSAPVMETRRATARRSGDTQKHIPESQSRRQRSGTIAGTEENENHVRKTKRLTAPATQRPASRTRSKNFRKPIPLEHHVVKPTQDLRHKPPGNAVVELRTGMRLRRSLEWTAPALAIDPTNHFHARRAVRYKPIKEHLA